MMVPISVTLVPSAVNLSRGNTRRVLSECRVALHRRNRPDGGAMVAVAQRVFAKELREAQMAARRELRELHKEQREQLRGEYG